MLCEFEERTGQRQRGLIRGHAGETLPHAYAGGQVLAVHLIEQRLVIEEIVLRRAAAHEQINNPLGLGREVRPVEDSFERVDGGRRRAKQVAIEQAEQSRATKTQREASKKVPSIHLQVDMRTIHKRNTNLR